MGDIRSRLSQFRPKGEIKLSAAGAMRSFFEKALEKAGHHVIACADGDRALRALKFADGAFDMLLTDIMMPGMDGIELAKQADLPRYQNHVHHRLCRRRYGR